jgi:hypothetical protein
MDEDYSETSPGADNYIIDSNTSVIFSWRRGGSPYSARQRQRRSCRPYRGGMLRESCRMRFGNRDMKVRTSQKHVRK